MGPGKGRVGWNGKEEEEVMPPGRARHRSWLLYLPFFMSWVWRGARAKAGMVLACLGCGCCVGGVGREGGGVSVGACDSEGFASLLRASKRIKRDKGRLAYAAQGVGGMASPVYGRAAGGAPEHCSAMCER